MMVHQQRQARAHIYHKKRAGARSLEHAHRKATASALSSPRTLKNRARLRPSVRNCEGERTPAAAARIHSRMVIHVSGAQREQAVTPREGT